MFSVTPKPHVKNCTNYQVNESLILKLAACIERYSRMNPYNVKTPHIIIKGQF